MHTILHQREGNADSYSIGYWLPNRDNIDPPFYWTELHRVGSFTEAAAWVSYLNGGEAPGT